MKKIIFVFVLLLIVVGGTFLTQRYLNGEQVSFFKKTPIVKISNHNFNVTVADSQKEREIGLSQTKSLSQNQGMIFLFEKSDYHYFWMKNMKFPIDIIYINKDQIVTIKNNAQPIKDKESPTIYSPTQPADKVLEISAGLAKKYKFKEGDKVKYENLGN